ncbi:MAG: PqqD family protein [Candidatus Omnitrophica bacterium]|nr:PqqD family protein [Candidatus Omnitrophota bacterium]
MSEKIFVNETTVFKKNPAIQEIKTEEGIIISSSNIKDKCVYYLDNEVSFRIWELIDGKNSLDKIKEELFSQYDVDKETLENDLKSFINNLYFKKIIIKC